MIFTCLVILAKLQAGLPGSHIAAVGMATQTHPKRATRLAFCWWNMMKNPIQLIYTKPLWLMAIFDFVRIKSNLGHLPILLQKKPPQKRTHRDLIAQTAAELRHVVPQPLLSPVGIYGALSLARCGYHLTQGHWPCFTEIPSLWGCEAIPILGHWQ